MRRRSSATVTEPGGAPQSPSHHLWHPRQPAPAPTSPPPGGIRLNCKPPYEILRANGSAYRDLSRRTQPLPQHDYVGEEDNSVATTPMPWEEVSSHTNDGLRFALEKAAPRAPLSRVRPSPFPALPVLVDQVLDLSNLVHTTEELHAVLATLRCQAPFVVRALSLKGCQCLKLTDEALESVVQQLADFLAEARGAPASDQASLIAGGGKKPKVAQGTACIEVLYLGDAGALTAKHLKALHEAWRKQGHLHTPEACPEPDAGLPVTLKRKPVSYAPAPAARLACMPHWAAENAAVKPKKPKDIKGKKKK